SLRISDLASAATCHELLALAVRRVVRMWHAGVGESVASYSAAYPFELVTRMASGAVSAFRSQAPALPLGRSSSYAISRILQGSLAYILGSGLYPGCLHCPRARRGPMDLSVGFVKETSSRMQRCVDAFQLWCTEWLRIIFSSLLQDMSLMAQSLWFVLFRGRFASVSFCLHFDWRARVLSFNPITSRNCLANRQKVADS
ncbi:unnamed protein product, partial [Durusdinium trenchii]